MLHNRIFNREDPRDALVLRNDYKDHTLGTLPENSTIGTSSLRRGAQLARKYPHLKVESIRGNLNTRLKKLDELGKFHGLILAAAGLHRMGWHHRISKIIESEELLYAVGQGALAVECRENDSEILILLKSLYDVPTALRIVTERMFLKTLGGGCSAPVAVSSDLTSVEDNKYKIRLQGAVWSLDGKDELLESEDSLLEIKEMQRCAQCPYSKLKTTDSSCSKSSCSNIDIECLQECSFKNKCGGNPSKKQKLSDGTVKEKQEMQNTIKDLLENDPHDHCPINIPVGFDFMGKCPFLESKLGVANESKCPVNGEVLGTSFFNVSKCPFMADGGLKSLISSEASSTETSSHKAQVNTNLFCGLVMHPDVPRYIYEEAEKLGQRLALKLIDKGAVSIMSKAQEHIRSAS